MRILVSGFEPFDGMLENPSEKLMKELQKISFPFELKTIVLPVSFQEAFDPLKNLIESWNPDVVIATGVAVNRNEITPERIAINWNDARTVDNLGVQAKGYSIPGAPDGLFSTLPIQDMVDSSKDVGTPAAISNSAGTYVCNHLMFHLLHYLQGNDTIQAGFVHIPPSSILPMEKLVTGFGSMLNVFGKKSV